MALAFQETTAHLGGDWFGGAGSQSFALSSRRLLTGGQRSSLERVSPPSTETRRAKMGLRALPTIALTCGANIPCGEAVPTSALAGAVGQLSAFFCPELDTVLDRLEVQLRRVPKVPAGQGDARVSAAVRFYARNRATFGAMVAGESCKNAVEEGKRLIAQVNDYLADLGRAQVAVPEVEVSGETGISQQVSKVRTSLVAVAVVAAAVVVAPLVWRLALSLRRKS